MTVDCCDLAIMLILRHGSQKICYLIMVTNCAARIKTTNDEFYVRASLKKDLYKFMF